MLCHFLIHPYLFWSGITHPMSHCVMSTYCVHRDTHRVTTFFFTIIPLTHYLTTPPHADASKKGSVSTNEAWDHFTDGWLIPQMHQPDQSPIYHLLISTPRAALLSSEKNWFTTKIWAMITVSTLRVCVFPYGWWGGSSPTETLHCTLCKLFSPCIVRMNVYVWVNHLPSVSM